MADVEAFRNRIVDCGFVLDPEGTHHEFNGGMHGQKLDFDNIDERGRLYSQWIEVTTSFIAEKFPKLPEVIIGVANGTNRVALDTARSFDGDVIGLKSVKVREDSKQLYIPTLAARIIAGIEPDLVVVIEDVGTTGGSSVQVAKKALDLGASAVEVVTTWKRREHLEKLDEANIPHHAIIDEPLPTYEPVACQRDEDGFCYRGWEFIPREV